MPDPKDLPHLIKLLSDESPVVREAVSNQLFNFGSRLETELGRLLPPLTEEEKERIHQILELRHRSELQQKWTDWLRLPSGEIKLEKGLSLLSDFQNGPHYPQALTQLLDRLAEEFARTAKDTADVLQLAQFLFKTKQLHGTQKDDYNPAHSNLVYVIENKEGIPISLACIYILVAQRLDLKVEGCNFPNHFLARIYTPNGMLLVDCFNGGKCYSAGEILEMLQENREALKAVLHIKADSESIMRRVLSNLIWAYQNQGLLDPSQWLSERLEDLNAD